ncbi:MULTISPECIES: hypothetical protein [unclassified Burkholderia]|uniref:hypothetical protein n=1 Tax=unclassified Burkholderia TaxID=2613784 RepID=UPI0011A1A116|nr:MULTISPECIES: hypothetical protein [unclassified Burkholderia]
MTRHDAEAEVTRRNNALARLEAREVILAGLSDDGVAAMIARLPKKYVRLCTADDVPAFAPPERAAREPLRWGHDAIGAGVLRALYEGRLIEFDGSCSPSAVIAGKTAHLVVCEAGEPLSEVIAANYAFALGAGLCTIPKVDETDATDILEAYYSIDDGCQSQAETRQHLKARLRRLCGDIVLPRGGSLTFFSRKLPFGVAFPELPSTHLFTYPDLGIAVINGFVAEQPNTRGVNVAVLVDPERTRAPEIEAAAKVLPSKQILVRGCRGAAANVRDVTEMVDLFPYDLLIFATHCGDAKGYRWTYQFTDSEHLERELVVDIAIGVGQTDDSDMLNVTQFIRFHSLDGVDWNDPIAKAKLHVGTAILDYIERTGNGDLKPVRKESVDRVRMSAAMAMHDHNYLAMPRALAGHGSPIVINNACVSWHQLAERFMFAGARAYIGTLYPVNDLEAEAIVVKILDKYWGKSLPHAVWSAQNSIYSAGSDRRPYVVTGVYIQRLRVTVENIPSFIMKKLVAARDHWKKRLVAIGDHRPRKQMQEFVQYYDREIEALRRAFMKGR